MKLILILFIICLSDSEASYRDDYAKLSLTQESKDYLLKPLQPDETTSRNERSLSTNFKVGIIGAGMSGLYAALILNSLGIDFEIFEANSEHVGGRAYTFYNRKYHSDPKQCKSFYDYFEMGAMRIPQMDKRVIGNEPWSLVNYLASHKQVILNKPKTIKFHYSNDNSIYFFNNRKVFYDNDQLNDPLAFGDAKNGGNGIPDEYAAKAYWNWLDLAVKPFTEMMKTNPRKAFEVLAQNENESVRGFMARFDSNSLLQSLGFPARNETSGRNYPQIVIDWIESLDAGTGLYDRSLAETVIDAAQFGSTEWFTIDGGVSRLAHAMVEVVGAKRIRMGTKVRKITKDPNSRQLTIVTEKWKTYKYDHVISTVPLGLLQNMDTRGLNLGVKTRMAIQKLTYEASVKIGLKFRTRWWENPAKMMGKPIIGGQTFTDLPIRKIVYPSHGVDCKDMEGNLLVYLWGQDATRLGSRISGKIPSQSRPQAQKEEGALIQDVLYQLTLIHGKVVRDEYLSAYFAFDWNNNPLAMGAFPLFGPGQFNTLYPDLIKAEVNGTMHFGGDAASVHHGWIKGALNAGYRTVMEILMKHNGGQKVLELEEKWGRVEELDYMYFQETL